MTNQPFHPPSKSLHRFFLADDRLSAVPSMSLDCHLRDTAHSDTIGVQIEGNVCVFQRKGCFDWQPIKGSLLFSASVKRWLTHSLRVKVIYPLLLQTLLKAAWLQSGLPARSVKPISSCRLTWKRRKYIIGRLFPTTGLSENRCMKSGHLMFGHTFRCDRNVESFGAAQRTQSC